MYSFLGSMCDMEVHPENHTYILAVLLSMPVTTMNNTQQLITKELAILREGGSIRCFHG